ncbi:MAG: type II TA system antitoxin MqsA family protein [Limnochordia bacterium]
MLPQRLYCGNCDSEEKVRVIERPETIEVRREPIDVRAQVAVCELCGEDVFCEQLDDATLEKAYDIYRKQHRLLSPEEIKDIRTKYGLSQRAFARLLGWGEATISRYEAGALPDKGHSLRLRDFRSPLVMQQLLDENGNALSPAERARVEERLYQLGEQVFIEEIERMVMLASEQKPSIYNGYRMLDLERLAHLIIYFAESIQPLCKTALMKLLFYADFLHFREYSVSVTGASYVKLPYGPVPDNYKYLLSTLEDKGYFALEPEPFGCYEGEVLRPVAKFDPTLFSPDELTTIKRVAGKLGGKSASDLSRLSHEEEAWKDAEPSNRIPYTFAGTLRAI